MGNTPTTSSVSSSATAIQALPGTKATFPSSIKNASEENEPRRYGSEGLRGLGFEYRVIPCCEQHDDHNNSYRPDQICWRCQTALYHITTGIRITAKNRPDFIPNGKRFEEVSSACQEVIQERILRDCSLSWKVMNPNDATRPSIRTIWNSSTFNENHPTLLVITGKGLSRAGILSVKYILEQSIEVGSALFYIEQALSSGFNIMLLDPNAWGADYGKDTIEISLDAILNDHTTTCFHTLSHSAGGGYFVRYLLEHDHLLDRCPKLVFTDSTHNVQWAKNNPRLFQFLQSQQSCLYVRNNSENSTDTFSKHKHNAAGEKCKGDRFWKQRFGDIPTVWAGTTDHSLMCYEARNIIWDFLRSVVDENGQAKEETK